MLQKSDVTRDAKGQVTEVINYEPNDDFSELEMESKITFEYKNNKINNIVYYGYDEGIETKISIINIIWEKYNGKILSAFGKAIDDIVYDTENLIKLASMELMSEDIYVPGSAVGTYTGETKRKLDVDFNFYGTPVAQFIYEYNQTDNNGSNTYTSEAKSMGKQIYLLTFTNKFNEKKDLIEKTEKENIADEEGGMTSYEESSKYEYSYNESTGLADYAIVNSLNTDNNQYETTQKLVFSDYKDVTAGISNAIFHVASLGSQRSICISNRLCIYIDTAHSQYYRQNNLYSNITFHNYAIKSKCPYFIVVTLLRPTTCQVALAVLHALANRVDNVPQTIDWLYPPRHIPSEVRLFLLPKLCQRVDYRQVDILLF